MGALSDTLLFSGEGPELLLVRSLLPDAPAFTPTYHAETDAVLAAIAGQVTPEHSAIAEEFGGGDSEREWLYAKLTHGAYPPINYGLGGYELCHSILHATDFTRAPVTDSAAAGVVEMEMRATQNPDLYAELALCLNAVGGTVTEGTKATLRGISYPLNSHTMYILAMAEANGLI